MLISYRSSSPANVPLPLRPLVGGARGKRLDDEVHCSLSLWRFATQIPRGGETRTSGAPSPPNTSRPQCLERCADPIGEVLRLFPCQEMAALGRALVMQKLRERALGP